MVRQLGGGTVLRRAIQTPGVTPLTKPTDTASRYFVPQARVDMCGGRFNVSYQFRSEPHGSNCVWDTNGSLRARGVGSINIP